MTQVLQRGERATPMDRSRFRRPGRNATRNVSRAALRIGRMNILLDCASCGDEVVFTVNETDDELACSACNTRMDFAPDPATTYGLLYGAAQAA
jgi:hypothetical protein